MAYYSDHATIGGVKVKVADGTHGGGSVGKSQTVNVYDSSNTEGNYRQVYRCRDRAKWITAGQLQGAVQSLDSLDEFLTSRGFQKEGPRRRR